MKRRRNPVPAGIREDILSTVPTSGHVFEIDWYEDSGEKWTLTYAVKKGYVGEKHEFQFRLGDSNRIGRVFLVKGRIDPKTFDVIIDERHLKRMGLRGYLRLQEMIARLYEFRSRFKRRRSV